MSPPDEGWRSAGVGPAEPAGKRNVWDDDLVAAEAAGRQHQADDWRQRCSVNRDKVIRQNFANVCIALRLDDRWRGRLSYDELQCMELLAGRPIDDAAIAEIRHALQLDVFPNVLLTTIHEAVSHVARERRFHPVRDYLTALQWDGVSRIDRWLSYYLGADAGEYPRLAGRFWLIAAVARAFKPGCKADHMLILEGRQGAGKSSAIRTLGGKWFSDSLPSDLGGKEASQALRGKWLIEVAELASMTKTEANAFKYFVSRQEERYRPPYGRREVHELRQCVFVGTTNQGVYLRDPTGARRFWPVKCNIIDLGALAHDRNQLWAEAAHAYSRGDPWWPDRETEARLFKPEQERRSDEDAWTDPIRAHLAGLTRTTVGDVATRALQFDRSRIGRADQNRITAVLEALGWTRGGRVGNHTGARYWIKGAGE